MGALIFFHQGGETLVTPRTKRYHLPNSIGNLVDRAVTFATLVHGGVMDAFPELRIVLGHGGGDTCFGSGRMGDGSRDVSKWRELRMPAPSSCPRFFCVNRIHYTVSSVV